MDREANRDIDLTDIIRLNVKNLEYSGCFCPNFKNKLALMVYYMYSGLFIGFIYISFMVSEATNMVLVFGDVEKMTKASFLLLTHLVEALKLYVFIVHKNKVRKLINNMNRKEFKPINKEQYQILTEDIKVSRYITKVFLFMCVATCIAWGFFPLLDKDKENNTIKLPLSGWFPFDTRKSPMFETVYVYLTVGAMINGLVNISMDTFLSGITMFIAGQLKILNNNFQNLRKNNSLKYSGYENKVMQEKIIMLVLHHTHIINFANNMTFLFGTCIMGQFVVSVIIICITMFQMSLVSVLSLEFLSMALYQACMILEIFLWCYFGNEVILQSDKLTQSAFSCEWIDCTKEFKRDLLFFITKTQVPLKLYAGGYFTLSLDTFMAIVKSSWSYFAVLNRVHSK